MAEHLSGYDEDDDGFVIASCSCKQWGPFPAPDHETASDAFADHMREVGQLEVAESHQAEWSSALILIFDMQEAADSMLTAIEAADGADDIWYRNQWRPIAERIEAMLSDSQPAPQGGTHP